MGSEMCIRDRFRAVKNKIGVSMPSNLAVRHTANPSIPGIITSKMATPNRCPRRASNASVPFLMEELLLRLDRLMDQTPSESWTQIERATIGEGSADFLAFEATSYDGTVRKLSKREGMLLKLLIGKEGEVVSREDILQMVWGYDVLPSTRTIDNFILAFRKTYERDPKSPKHFHSVRGVGYKFTR